MKKVGIIDLDSGNLNSLYNAVLDSGAYAEIISKPSDDFDALFLPGQGRFAHVVSRIDSGHWRPFLTEWQENKNRLIGICVGMQVLFESSEEDPDFQGLGFLQGQVKKLTHPKTPMIGWAKLNSTNNFWNGQYAYFVNSFAIQDSEFCTSQTRYGDSFCASVQQGQTFGFQYHPEKSGAFGKEVIKQCLQ